MEDPDQEWDMVYFLRQVCMGREIEPEPKRALIRERLLQSDGTPAPDMKAVVLSSVRGEDRAIHISSPFTDPVDRAMADFIISREYIRANLPKAVAESFLADDKVKWANDILRRPKNWAGRESAGTELPPNAPGGPLS